MSPGVPFDREIFKRSELNPGLQKKAQIFSEKSKFQQKISKINPFTAKLTLETQNLVYLNIWSGCLLQILSDGLVANFITRKWNVVRHET